MWEILILVMLEHLPAIQACAAFSLKAIYSRSSASATALAGPAKVDAYFDSPSDPTKSLEALLKREDISAVVVALPILVQPAVIKKFLAAGKHVLSEKPIAKDVRTAEDLIKWHAEQKGRAIWSVAENFRFLDSIEYAAQQIKKIGGDVVTFSFKLYGFVDESDKFYQTPWCVFTIPFDTEWLLKFCRRQVPEYQGGFLLDGGVHFVAGLRYLLAAGNEQITDLAAFTSLIQKKLPPVDTVHATLRITNGNNGTFNLSFGAEFKSGFEIEVVTDKGAVNLTPAEVTVTTKVDGEKKETVEKFEFSSGVKAEIVAFSKSIEAGNSNEKGTPQQALTDLRILQSMLESGEQGGKVQAVLQPR